MQQMQNKKEQLKMKTPNHNFLQFSFTERGGFTLPIQKKTLQLALSPLSSKKLTTAWRGWPGGSGPRNAADFTAVIPFGGEHAITWTHVDRATAGCLRIHRRIASKRIGTGG
jgi:hypothetical protein